MRFLKADKIFDGKATLPSDRVLVIDEKLRIKEIISEEQAEPGNIERFEGILTPGFVNAHCHLELSHLKGHIPQGTGLPGFARHIVTRRSNFKPEEVLEQMQAADKEMQANGIAAVGDISNTSGSFSVKRDSPVFYHTFVELIGLNPAGQEAIFGKGLELLCELKQQGLSGSLAPHAPYSTSTPLIKKIADYDAANGLPFTIHNQESGEEQKFFNGVENGFNDLYKFLGLDLSWYSAPKVSSLRSYIQGLSSRSPSLLVHNTLSTKEDVALAAEKNIFWCFCPGANLYIEQRLPVFELFAGHSRICLGTDSLASNTQLDVLAEANLILKHSRAYSSEDLLRAITSNAAAALGISDRFGSFIPGMNCGLNLVQIHNSELRLLKKLV